MINGTHSNSFILFSKVCKDPQVMTARTFVLHEGIINYLQIKKISSKFSFLKFGKVMVSLGKSSSGGTSVRSNGNKIHKKPGLTKEHLSFRIYGF